MSPFNHSPSNFGGGKRKNGGGGGGGGVSPGEGVKRGRFSGLENGEEESLRILRQRKELPMAEARNRFLEEVSKHSSVVLIGETGSGKTTQVPQFLVEAGFDAKGAVAVTQPRRVAATSIATRVSREMGKDLGTTVGYRVRFEDVTSEDTRIVYMTDGLLLREAMLDPLLSSYAWVLLDEAHERTVNTDILLGIVKAAQRSRQQTANPLKVIIMSATLEAQRFSSYFPGGAPVLYVSGRQFPVNVRHASQSQDDWQLATLATVFQIHKTAPERHDILVFMTGQDEIESAAHQLRQAARDLEDGLPKLQVLSLFAAQSLPVQQKVFHPTNPGFRKVIISTNLAETSLTIPGIRYVVDSCRVKAKAHQASTGIDMLKVVKISQAQAAQRTGRAGREAEGHCYRILTKAEFDRLPENTVPEIKRCNLSSVILQMLSVGVKDIRRFDFLEKPPEDAIEGALRLLKLLGAVDAQDKITQLGKKMSAFPLDPKFTKVLLCAAELGCTEEIITIISILSGEAILMTPALKREEAIQARKKFSASEGDHVMYLKVFRAFSKIQPSEQMEWCRQHFVQNRHLKFAMEVRRQLMDLCRRHDIPVQSAGPGQTEPVRRALARGLFTNVARLTKEGHHVTLDSRQKVRVHPSSVFFQTKPEFVVFTELTATQHCYVRDLTLVDPAWLTQCQPEYFRQHRITATGD